MKRLLILGASGVAVWLAFAAGRQSARPNLGQPGPASRTIPNGAYPRGGDVGWHR